MITGAAKGIGAACVQKFMLTDANVALLEIDEKAPEFLNEKCYYIQCDVSQEVPHIYGQCRFFIDFHP